MKAFFMKIRGFIKECNLVGWAIFFLLIYTVVLLKFISLENYDDNILLFAYSFAISIYLLSRFVLSFFHAPEIPDCSGYEPAVTFGVPSKNEEENIKQTILKIAESNYPKDKMEIIAVNDGSTDRTLDEMNEAKRIAKGMGVKVKVIDWKVNRGKREGMAECVRQSESEIIVFIDSDSFVEKNTLRELIKYFCNKRVGAVAGHAFVANEHENALTRMQALQYYISFKTFKTAESLFGNVTCCSGCCAAYRREYIISFLDQWEHQMFWGVKCTYGDDRSLTNFLLKHGYDTVFSPTAISYTVVPNNLKTFVKQRLRWKKSWTRECWNAAKFMWRKNPIMSVSFYLSFILPLISPFVMVRALIVYPITKGELPIFYILGLLTISILYGVYYKIFTRDKQWFTSSFYLIIYTLLMVWQLPYAIATLRDSRWGTR